MFKLFNKIGRQKQYWVIIPHQNLPALMLNEETRTALAKKALIIYPVRYFWQVFELATGIPLGVKKPGGKKVQKDSAIERIRNKIKQVDQNLDQTK